jgi:phosphonopyruvate decarboxylase
MDIKNFTIGKDTTVEELEKTMNDFEELLNVGKQVAFVIKKGALTYDDEIQYGNDNDMLREEIIEHIVNATGENPIISTTGKASRELFEIRERNNQSHKYDFLTVGSMGHTSSIALGVAINRPDEKVWCIDGDGSVLMHMGAMAVAGSTSPKNLVHIVINNGAHETVGGMPTVANSIDLVSIAKACGYSYVASVDNFDDLDNELDKVKNLDCLSLIEIKSSIGAREDLGRPTTTAIENKENFMSYINK